MPDMNRYFKCFEQEYTKLRQTNASGEVLHKARMSALRQAQEEHEAMEREKRCSDPSWSSWGEGIRAGLEQRNWAAWYKGENGTGAHSQAITSQTEHAGSSVAHVQGPQFRWVDLHLLSGTQRAEILERSLDPSRPVCVAHAVPYC